MNGHHYNHMNGLLLICKSGSPSLGDNGIQDQYKVCHLPGKPFSEELFNGVIPVGSGMF